jgi:drug/metabolite transporter (DMT)-like permease
MMAIGMLLIFSGFGLLVHQAFTTPGESAQEKQQTAFGKLASRGYLFGPISALAYASGYVARKQGLLVMPDAVFGTMIGALTGMLLFVAVSFYFDWYRDDLRASITVFNPWLLAAGLFGSLGQMAYFAALTYSPVSKIALITSLEVFMTMFLSYLVFRGRVRITREVIVAATLGVIGSLFVIRY